MIILENAKNTKYNIDPATVEIATTLMDNSLDGGINGLYGPKRGGDDPSLEPVF